MEEPGLFEPWQRLQAAQFETAGLIERLVRCWTLHGFDRGNCSEVEDSRMYTGLVVQGDLLLLRVSNFARYEKLDAEGHPTESFAVKEVDLQILRCPRSPGPAVHPTPTEIPGRPAARTARSSRVGADQERLVRWVARLEFEAGCRRSPEPMVGADISPTKVRNLMKLKGHPGVVKVSLLQDHLQCRSHAGDSWNLLPVCHLAPN